MDYPAYSLGRFTVEVFDLSEDSPAAGGASPGRARSAPPATAPSAASSSAPPDGKVTLWMSDTRAEILEHAPVLNRLRAVPPQASAGVLVNGLGLGLVVRAALMSPGVAHVDVIEKDPDIARLIGPRLPASRVTVTIADALEARWPDGTRWDLAWHDIWPDISDLNLPRCTS